LEAPWLVERKREDEREGERRVRGFANEERKEKGE